MDSCKQCREEGFPTLDWGWIRYTGKVIIDLHAVHAYFHMHIPNQFLFLLHRRHYLLAIRSLWLQISGKKALHQGHGLARPNMTSLQSGSAFFRPGGKLHLFMLLIALALSRGFWLLSLPNPQQAVLSLACAEIMIKLIRPEIEWTAAAT